MNIEEIPRPEVGELIEVVTSWEEGVKSLEIGIARIPIPARNVRPQAQAWVKAYLIPGVTDVGGRRPGPDVPAAKAPPLIEGLEVIVPAAGCAPEPRAYRVPPFMIAALRVFSFFGLEGDFNRNHSLHSVAVKQLDTLIDQWEAGNKSEVTDTLESLTLSARASQYQEPYYDDNDQF